MFKYIFLTVIFLYTSFTQAGVQLNIPLPLSFVQTDEDIIWVGTHNSILRYDGHNVEVVSKTKDNVYQLIAYNQQIIYFSTNNVYAINRFYQRIKILEANDIKHLALFENELYILTSTDIITYSLTEQKVINNTAIEGVGKYSKLVLSSHYLCVSLQSNVTCFNKDNKTQKHFEHKNVRDLTIQNNRLYAVNEEGLIEIGYVQQFSRVIEKHKNITRVSPSLTKRYLWLSVDNQIKKFDLIDSRFVSHEYSRTNNHIIYSILETQDGVLWLAGSQVEKLSKSTIHQREIGLPSNSGMASIITAKGRHFIVDDFGLAEIDLPQGQARLITSVNEQLVKQIFAAYADGSFIWLGGLNGFYRIDIRNWQVSNFTDLLPFNIVMCIKEFDKNNLVLCLDNGQAVTVNKEKLAVTLLHGQAGNEIIDFEKGNEQRFWLASDQGIFHSTNSAQKQYFSDVYFIDLLNSYYSPKWIYAGSLNNGLYRFDRNDPTDYQHFNMMLLGERVQSIAEYGTNIWISTLLGVAKINQLTDKVSYFRLGKSVGRIFNEYGRFYSVASDGNLLFWSEEIEKNTYLPQILISELWVDQKLVLDYKNVPQGQLSEVRVMLNDYNYPEHHSFSYNVNDKGWNKFNHNNSITFKPLLGTNTINVKAVNSEGVAFDKSFSFYIASPWYLGEPALFLYFVLLANIVFFWRLQVNNAKQHHFKVMRGLYEKNHLHTAGDVAADLLPMCQMTEALIKTKNYQESLNSIEQIKEYIYVEANQSSVSQLKTDDLQKEIQYLAAIEGIQCDAEIVIAVGEFSSKTDAKIKRMKKYIYTFIREALINAVRHSDANIIHINVDLFSNQIHVSVTDDGIGIDKKQIQFCGIGLWEMRLISKLTRGKLKIENDNGTSVTLIIPINRKNNLK